MANACHADAFNERLVIMLPKLRAQAMVLCRNRAAADDLVQDAALHVLVGRASFVEGTNFSAWVQRIMRNSFISGLRRRRETVALDDAPQGMLIHLPDAEEHLALQELLQAVRKLSSGHRNCLLQVGLEGMNYAEVAAASRIAIGTAKSHVSRARQALRERVPSLAPSARSLMKGMRRELACAAKSNTGSEAVPVSARRHRGKGSAVSMVAAG